MYRQETLSLVRALKQELKKWKMTGKAEGKTT
jgi:hypothetical protein